MNTMRGDDLATLVQSLPPELYNSIFNLVLTAQADEARIINESYRFPPQLHISKASREQFTKTYYADGAVFLFSSGNELRWSKVIGREDCDRIICRQSSYMAFHRRQMEANQDPHVHVWVYYLERFESILKHFGYILRTSQSCDDDAEISGYDRVRDGMREHVRWKMVFFHEFVQFEKVE